MDQVVRQMKKGDEEEITKGSGTNRKYGGSNRKGVAYSAVRSVRKFYSEQRS